MNAADNAKEQQTLHPFQSTEYCTTTDLASLAKEESDKTQIFKNGLKKYTERVITSFFPFLLTLMENSA